LHVQIDLGAAGVLHVINVHLKSKLPTDIPGQKIDQFTWRTAAQIHNEVLHDESIAFATDRQYPESDHAPVVATFEF
jgi:exonuclease III